MARQTRRGLMTGLAGAPAALAALSVAGPGRAAEGIDLSRPADNLRALMKILASTDPAQTVYFYGSGRVYGCLSERAPVPLFGTHSLSICRAKAAPDGGFLLRQHIVGFRTAVDSETMIDSMTNPVTGQTVSLPPTDYGVADTDYRLDGTYALAVKPPLLMNKAGPRPWSLAGGVVSMSDDTVLAKPGPQHPKADVVTRSALASELADPAIRSANSWFSFSAVDPFRPWLKMTEPGFQLWHLNGRKAATLDDMPAFIRETAMARFPKLFDLPPFAA